MSNSKWDQNYLEMAHLVAGWSKDPNAQVGAVIVRNNRVVATGFNGFPAEVEDLDERLHFGHRDVVFVWMVNDCQDVDLLAYR